MGELSKNWLTEKHIDFEYKKSLLLAYLQDVGKNFNATKLYPWLAELIGHYKSAIEVKKNKQNLKKHFPHRFSGINDKGQLTFENMVSDDELMQELENIIEFAIPQFQHHMDEGKSIYDIVEERLQKAFPPHFNPSKMIYCATINTCLIQPHIPLKLK